MTTEQLSEKEIEYAEILLGHTKRKVEAYLDNHNIPYKYRLLLYLATPKVCFCGTSVVPAFFEFTVKHGDINWKEDFPFLLRDQSVNLVKICRTALQGNYTYFPAHWTSEMLFDFVKCCVDLGIHEFDYCY
jgi:hypothetical protein